PSHLLGKKSWNVYNPANIARVRRDEAAAQAKEEAEEQRMQEADAARRLAILRGETPPPLESDAPSPLRAPARQPTSNDDRHGAGVGRKRKRPGEDDTDLEMRLARETAAAGSRAAHEPAAAAPTPPLVDSNGHISLFPAPATPPPAAQSADAARKERALKDQYQMRLVNAAGRDGRGLTDGGPWYASGEGGAAPAPSRDVWGREDPRRKGREAKRLGASDPLAMMKR
ncbi:hypothetical protein BT67DRAFT_360312, partial [Trichocladium antarcticum]